MRRVFFWDKATKTFCEYRPADRPDVHVVMQDTIEATRHPCDGRYYDSKSAYDAVTRRHGAVECGPEGVNKMMDWRPPEVNVRSCIDRAIEKVNQGYQPAPKEYDARFNRFYNRD